MKLVLTVLASAFLLVSSVAMSGPRVDLEKAIVIDGVIAQGNILPLGVEMLRRAEQVDIEMKGPNEVHLIINSPGGEVVTGFLFLNLMKAAQQKGLKVVCFVPTIAASMAYQIFLHCDERHTLNHAFLLWHRARINLGGMFGAPMTAPQLMTLGQDLASLDAQIFDEVVEKMGSEMSVESLAYHFEVETLHTGLNLHKLAPKFVTTHSAVDGVFEALMDSETVPRNDKMGINALQNADYIYITNRSVGK